jgi:hypothetical protein
MEILHKRINIEIKYDPDTKIMFIDWIGLQTQDLLRTSGEDIHTLFRDKECTRILNDNTHVVGPWYHSVEWTSQEWFPRMFAAGLKRFAWVISPDIFAHLSAKRALPDSGLVKTFEEYEEAYNWLIK